MSRWLEAHSVVIRRFWTSVLALVFLQTVLRKFAPAPCAFTDSSAYTGAQDRQEELVLSWPSEATAGRHIEVTMMGNHTSTSYERVAVGVLWGFARDTERSVQSIVDLSSFVSHRQLVREDVSSRRRFPNQPPTAITPPVSSLGRTR